MNIKNILKNILSVIFWILIWYVFSLYINLEVILPSPLATVKKLFENISGSSFWISCLFSLIRIMTGLILGAIFAIILSALTYTSKTAKALFSPVLTVIKATPVASFILLMLIWMGKENVPTFITFLMVLPIIWSATSNALENVPVNLLEMASVFGFSKAKKIRHIYIPEAFNAFLSSFTTSVGIAWKAGVAAEVLCTPKYSLGTKIFESKKYIETTDLFSYTLTVIILSLIIEKLLTKSLKAIAERSELRND